MTKKYYRKLVRDRIPEVLEESGKNFKTHRAQSRTVMKYLAMKLVEEAKEFQENPSNEELADVHEVLRAIAVHSDFTPYGEMGKKAHNKGRFEKMIILDWVEE